MWCPIDLGKSKRGVRQGLLSEEGVVVRFRVGGFEGDNVKCDELDQVDSQTRLV